MTDTTMPERPLEDEIGYHDPTAVVLDTLPPDATTLPAEVQDDAEQLPVRSFLASVVRTGAAARAWAMSRTRFPVGYCLIFVHDCFNVGAYYGSARLGWLYAAHKHPHSSSGIPADVPIWWLGGSRGFGHVAYSLGNGMCRSTDWPSSGQIGNARIDDITRAWNLSFQGWTEDVNRARVYTPAPAERVVDLSQVIAGLKSGNEVTNGLALKRAVAAEVGLGPMFLVTGRLGAGFKRQYALVQRKYLASLGLTPHGNDADGIPGIASLTWLGHRHGFKVES